MKTNIIDGKKLAAEREEQLKERVARFVSEFHRKPMLVAVEISDDPGGQLYLKLKRAAATRIGIEFEIVKRSDLAVLQGRTFIHADGIFIQHPPRYDKKKWQELVDQIPSEKDVDCLTTENLNLIKQGKPRFLPATVKAVGYCLLEVAQVSHVPQVAQAKNLDCDFTCVTRGTCVTCDTLRAFLKEKRIVILGRSPILGLPLSWWLKSLRADVKLLHSKTSSHELCAACRRADILISSVGKPKIITGDMVKKGVIVIDCGSPVGDVVFGEVAPKASAITPVPGGVGPLTVVSLMENVIAAAERQQN